DMKLVFTHGIHLQDSQQLFNARLFSSGDRAIEFHEGDVINEAGITALVREAAAFNESKPKK
ncbi:MAG TPA: hypothetical protein VG992_03800, partial [Candidatus Saccharimonadales bacterium]|nr:hypothetical protein [Candidatus Saccharimonadales bacterium]